jgi:hypothetical protein
MYCAPTREQRWRDERAATPELDGGAPAPEGGLCTTLWSCLRARVGIRFFLAACSRLAGLEGSCSAPTFRQSTI